MNSTSFSNMSQEFTVSVNSDKQIRESVPHQPGTVLFAVDKEDSGRTIIDPIVIINKKHYSKPPTGGDFGVNNSDSPDALRFIADFYPQGKKYRMLFGGGEIGTVIVDKRVEESCVSLVAGIQLPSTTQMKSATTALATNSDTLGRKKSLRNDPTAGQRKALLAIARNLYRRKGVSDKLIQNMKVVGLDATDLDGDGQMELIGSFTVEENGNDWEHSLFVIAELQHNRYQPALTWYFRGNEGTSRIQRFIDQVDLDGDGIAEVVTQMTYYESWDFIIYKKRNGQWQRIYKGGGGGC